MFIARIVLEIQEPHREAFRRFANGEALAARALDGCVEYAFAEDVADPTRVFLYEEWSSKAAFEAYKQSPVFAASGANLRPLLAAPPKSAYYESENVFTAARP